MRRLALSLALILVCGTVAAEQIGASKPPSAPKAAAAPDAAKKAPAKKAVAKGPPAKELFGTVSAPAPLEARAIGSYARGCLAGGISLPINGPDWQVMRLSRNRNWGHPRLLDYLERFASDARGLDGWPGLLVGDMAQPRGGPMITGHTSHQIGLDADIWLTPMPDRILTPHEREDMVATSMLKDPFNVDPAVFTQMQVKLIKRAASYPQVARIFVHPAIKKALCEMAGKDRAWLSKVRPWWNHYYHFHIRLTCPPGAESCENQKPAADDDGCGTELANWYKMLRVAEAAAPRKPVTGPAPPSKKPPIGVGDLPAECRTVLNMKPGSPEIAPDGTVPAALKLEASKDAGPPLPHLDDAALAVLKAQLAPKKKTKPATATASSSTGATNAAAAAKPAKPAAAAAAPAVAATPSAVGPTDTDPGDDSEAPPPDRKPSP